MALKGEHALLVGVAAAGVVFGLHQITVPNTASVRASPADNIHVESARKAFTITAASLVVLLGAISRDPTVFLIGGLSVIALDVNTRIANSTDHKSGKMPIGANAAAAGTPSSASAAITVTGS
jgi:hypothetical protein